MFYTSIHLKNYRSYSDFSVEFGDGVNIVVGPNASGKTNLLEALLVASVGGSFRVNDRALIRYGEEELRLVATTNTDQERIVSIKTVGPDKTAKEFRINQVKHKRLSSNKVVPTVLFEPEHLRMIHGSPELRRDYLDTLLSQTTPEYKTTLNRYKKTLAHRNRLLKQERRTPSRDSIFVWDVQLSQYGEKLNSARRQLVEQINKEASTVYSAVSGKKSSLNLLYNRTGYTADDYGSWLLKNLHSRFEVDLQRGFTTIGPHREDVEFIINQTSAAESASRGETRSIVLVCKILELSLIEATLDQKPIILLDDVFSELDGSRRLALTDYLKNHQTIITTTDADAIVKSFLDGYTVIATS